ncbi:MAG: CvpA family protein [Blautia sp.]|nr:CvpA family protein [Blautia sp.]
MTWTWLGIVAIIFIVLLGILGFRRGFIREVVSTAFVLLSLVLVTMINPYVNSFLRNNTPLEKTIREKCEALVEKNAQNIQNLGNEGQEKLLESLNLPNFVTQQIKQNNTGESYRQLAVNNFVDYVTSYLSNMLINGISFLISFLLVTVTKRVVLFLLDLIAKLPVIHGINQAAGAIIGGGKAVIYIWIVLLILTILCNTEIGKAGMLLVEQDSVLSFLYEKDLLIKMFLNIFMGNT